MGYWDQDETIPRSTGGSKKRTFDEIVDETINKQIRIMNGEQIPTSKPGKFLASWRNSATGAVDPKFSNMLLLPQGAKRMTEERYKEFLGDMEKWRDIPEIRAMIEDIPRRQEENKKKRAAKG